MVGSYVNPRKARKSAEAYALRVMLVPAPTIRYELRSTKIFTPPATSHGSDCGTAPRLVRYAAPYVSATRSSTVAARHEMPAPKVIEGPYVTLPMVDPAPKGTRAPRLKSMRTRRDGRTS